MTLKKQKSGQSRILAQPGFMQKPCAEGFKTLESAYPQVIICAYLAQPVKWGEAKAELLSTG